MNSQVGELEDVRNLLSALAGSAVEVQEKILALRPATSAEIIERWSPVVTESVEQLTEAVQLLREARRSLADAKQTGQTSPALRGRVVPAVRLVLASLMKLSSSLTLAEAELRASELAVRLRGSAEQGGLRIRRRVA